MWLQTRTAHTFALPSEVLLRATTVPVSHLPPSPPPTPSDAGTALGSEPGNLASGLSCQNDPDTTLDKPRLPSCASVFCVCQRGTQPSAALCKALGGLQ